MTVEEERQEAVDIIFELLWKIDKLPCFRGDFLGDELNSRISKFLGEDEDEDADEE